MKKLTTVLFISIGIFLRIGSPGTTSADGGNGNIVAGGGGSSGSGAIVIAWNQELLHIVQTPGAQTVTVHPTRSFAMLHVATYDSIVSITRNAPPYVYSLNAPTGALPDAAAATAGHDTLVALYPTMKTELDQRLTRELAMFPDGADKQQGIQVGHTIAEHVVASRANDGSATTPSPFVPGNLPGSYRPTPPNFAAPVFTHWGNVTPFVLNSGAQFRPAPPPALTSQAYAQALNEVKSLGQNSSPTRTAYQTKSVMLWAGSPWNTWNEMAEDSASAHHTNLEFTARLFALLNLSFADSAIAFYDTKYYYQLWRPITAIREANTIGNPLVVSDPAWTPLITTPPDPSYPAAHSTISAAGAVVLSSFFGDHDQVRVTYNGTTLIFASYTDAAMDTSLSRIYGGAHTRIDHEAGVKLGQNVAQFVLDHSASAYFGRG